MLCFFQKVKVCSSRKKCCAFMMEACIGSFEYTCTYVLRTKVVALAPVLAAMYSRKSSFNGWFRGGAIACYTAGMIVSTHHTILLLKHDMIPQRLKNRTHLPVFSDVYVPYFFVLFLEVLFLLFVFSLLQLAETIDFAYSLLSCSVFFFFFGCSWPRRSIMYHMLLILFQCFRW